MVLVKHFMLIYSFFFYPLLDCGGDIFRENGVIESPNFNLLSSDASYPSFSRCIWTINTKKNNYVSLKFQYFDVEGTLPGSCMPDNVVIRDGFDETSPLVGNDNIDITYNVIL